jgi:hypothetical protein
MKTHSKDMYNYLKSTLRYEIKVPVKKSEMMDPNFDNFLEKINKGSGGNSTSVTAGTEYAPEQKDEQ